MKVVIATPLYPPEIGGPATYVHLLEQELPKRSIEVVVVKFRDVRSSPRILRHFYYYRKVCHAAADADLVFALDPLSTGLPALMAARRVHVPFLLKIVGDYAWEQGVQRFGVTLSLDAFSTARQVPLAVRVLRGVQRYVARRAARIIVPSEYLRRIVTTWGVRPELISVIYNAVDVPSTHELPPLRRGLPPSFVLTAGRLVPWKHIEGVIDAVAQLPDLTLVIAGDGPERSALETRATRLKDRVLFVGQLEHLELLALMTKAEALVLNSSYEGLSHLLVEAVSLGVPVIATNAGGNGEVVQDGVNGMLVPVGDTKALVKALVARRSLGTEADTRFTKERMISETAAVLETV